MIGSAIHDGLCLRGTSTFSLLDFSVDEGHATPRHGSACISVTSSDNFAGETFLDLSYIHTPQDSSPIVLLEEEEASRGTTDASTNSVRKLGQLSITPRLIYVKRSRDSLPEDHASTRLIILEYRSFRLAVTKSCTDLSRKKVCITDKIRISPTTISFNVPR